MSEPPVHVLFTFGPDNGFFFEVGETRRWHNIPEDLEAIYNNQDPEEKVKETLCLALTEDGGYHLIYATEDLQERYVHKGGPVELAEWIEEGNLLEYNSVRFSIGKGNSFFALATYRCSCPPEPTVYRWKGLPARAEKFIQTQIATSHPESRCLWAVILGVEESFLAFQLRGGEYNDWQFNAIPLLLSVRVLDRKDLRGTRLIVINPFDQNHYFCILDDGTMEWDVDDAHKSAVQELESIYLTEYLEVAWARHEGSGDSSGE